MIRVHVTERVSEKVHVLKDGTDLVCVKVADNGGRGHAPIEEYDGEYTVDPKFDEQTLATKDKRMKDDVTVNPITVSRTTNLSGGTTVYIGGIING